MSDPLRIGFIPLADCAPLVVAKEKGFFAGQGLDVELRKAQSWDQVLQWLVEGSLEAAHMLLTLPLQWALRPEGRSHPLVYAAALSQHGNAITISNALWRLGVRDAASLRDLALSLPRKNPLKLAVVHPRSTHEYLLRLWLRMGGLEIGKGVDLEYAPPPVMVHRLREGLIDGFCAGEPWNQRAVTSKLGYIAATSRDLLPPMNEKVLAVRASWHDAHPEIHAALLRAVLAAAEWAADAKNREELTDLVAGKRYVNTARKPMLAAFSGEIQAGGGRTLRPSGFMRFHGEGANYPQANHARFYLEQMWRAGHADPEAATMDLERICLSKFYRESVFTSGLKAADVLPVNLEESYSSLLERFPKTDIT